VQNFVERVEKSSMLLDSVISRGPKGVGGKAENRGAVSMWPVKKLTRPGDEHGKLSTRHVGHKSAGDSLRGERVRFAFVSGFEFEMELELESGSESGCVTTANEEQPAQDLKEQDLEQEPKQPGPKQQRVQLSVARK